MKKILVSACLLGDIVRYDGKALASCPLILRKWFEDGLVIPICPEMDGGLLVPRPPAEIQEGSDGKDVIAGKASVIDIDGKDVTGEFLKGAKEALRLAEEQGVTVVVLKARSPSCGSKQTYDGTFSNVLKPGMGVAAALLTEHGIQVVNEEEIDQISNLIG